ncbi:hypothetical protein GGR50DRAFT_696129 [Xylaria sp. CBS 124048]|nr:hypothetical protein GGR50DRAFT_696129 [Xylaria sp. CBS 124048]
MDTWTMDHGPWTGSKTFLFQLFVHSAAGDFSPPVSRRGSIKPRDMFRFDGDRSRAVSTRKSDFVSAKEEYLKRNGYHGQSQYKQLDQFLGSCHENTFRLQFLSHPRELARHGTTKNGEVPDRSVPPASIPNTPPSSKVSSGVVDDIYWTHASAKGRQKQR